MPFPPPSGFRPIVVSPFIDHLGPFYAGPSGPGQLLYGARVEPTHANTNDTAHGGYLLALADVAVGRAVREVTGGPARTAGLSMDFVAPVSLGSWLELAVTVDHVRRRSVLTTCRLTVDGALTARATATLVTA